MKTKQAKRRGAKNAEQFRRAVAKSRRKQKPIQFFKLQIALAQTVSELRRLTDAVEKLTVDFIHAEVNGIEHTPRSASSASLRLSRPKERSGDSP